MAAPVLAHGRSTVRLRRRRRLPSRRRRWRRSAVYAVLRAGVRVSRSRRYAGYGCRGKAVVERRAHGAVEEVVHCMAFLSRTLALSGVDGWCRAKRRAPRRSPAPERSSQNAKQTTLRCTTEVRATAPRTSPKSSSWSVAQGRRQRDRSPATLAAAGTRAPAWRPHRADRRGIANVRPERRAARTEERIRGDVVGAGGANETVAKRMRSAA